MVYAIVYAYGHETINHSKRADKVYRLADAAERLRFIEQQAQEGVQVDAIKQSHPKVRKALRAAAQGYRWPQLV